MDYKYIEQLIERYFDCETTVEEEAILRTFFAQSELPAELSRYKDLFVYEQTQQKAVGLSEDFEKRILAKVEAAERGSLVVKARRTTIFMRLRPLYQAAAAVAVVVLMGTSVQYAFNGSASAEGWDYDAANYKDSYNTPREAYDGTVDKALDGIKEALLISKDNIETDSLESDIVNAIR